MDTREALRQQQRITQGEEMEKANGRFTRQSRLGSTAFTLLAIATACIGGAHAQGLADYPAKPVRIVVPYPPGGGVDTTARTIYARMTKALGQQLVIDNRGGASTIIGTEVVVKAPPDGYTLLLVTSTIAMNPSVFKKLPYDVQRDLVPVSMVITTPCAFAVHPTVPARSTADLIKLAKARPGQLMYPSSGIGSANHLAVVLFSRTAGIDTTHVPYKGTSQALTDLVAGHMQFSFNNPLAVLPLANAGRLRLLATTGSKRLSIISDVPTVGETVAGFEAGNWHGLFAPANTPKQILARLQAAITSSLSASEVKAKFVEGGAEPVGSSPEEFEAYFKNEIIKWGKTVKAAGIKPE